MFLYSGLQLNALGSQPLVDHKRDIYEVRSRQLSVGQRRRMRHPKVDLVPEYRRDGILHRCASVAENGASACWNPGSFVRTARVNPHLKNLQTLMSEFRMGFPSSSLRRADRQNLAGCRCFTSSGRGRCSMTAGIICGPSPAIPRYNRLRSAGPCGGFEVFTYRSPVHFQMVFDFAERWRRPFDPGSPKPLARAVSHPHDHLENLRRP